MVDPTPSITTDQEGSGEKRIEDFDLSSPSSSESDSPRHLLLTAKINAQSVVSLNMGLIIGLPAILAIAGTTFTALV